MNLGLVIPCRNEASVIARKLRNLADLDWPQAERPHRVLIVDDHSDDGTADLAREELRNLQLPASVTIEVIASEGQPGKPGAIRSGLAALADSIDCTGLSDADVILDQRAVRLALQAFEKDADLAMACGEQVFVEALPADGRVASLDSPLAPDAYDRATAWWRSLESRFGALFSVHGQFLVWRSDLDLAPELGFAADDLDLMLQVRERRPRAKTQLLPGAKFFESKLPRGEAGDAQALRRARAYVQFVRGRSLPPNQPFLRKIQWLAYRTVPLAAPAATFLLVILLFVFALATLEALGGLVATLLFGLCSMTAPGRAWLRSIDMIRSARKLESASTQPESWEMARTQ